MKDFRGIWLPDHEQHLVDHLARSALVGGKPGYQHDKLRRALDFAPGRRVAVDVGAHCGLWSRHLVGVFDVVHAFEPVTENAECFEMNVQGAHLYRMALGRDRRDVSMITQDGSSGDSAVCGHGGIPMRALDEFDFHNVDFVKVDCIGYELEVLRGAEQTLVRNRPCVCVEQKPGYAAHFGLPETGAVEYLQGLGAVLRAAMSGVYILSWKGAAA